MRRRLRALLVGLLWAAGSGAATGVAQYAVTVLPQREEIAGLAHALSRLAVARAEACDPCVCPSGPAPIVDAR